MVTGANDTFVAVVPRLWVPWVPRMCQVSSTKQVRTRTCMNKIDAINLCTFRLQVSWACVRVSGDAIVHLGVLGILQDSYWHKWKIYVKAFLPRGTKAIAVYKAASNCLNSSHKQNKNIYLELKEWLVVLHQNIVTFMLQCISFSIAKNWPPFEICRAVYLLLLTAMALVTSGKCVTSFTHKAVGYLRATASRTRVDNQRCRRKKSTHIATAVRSMLPIRAVTYLSSGLI